MHSNLFRLHAINDRIKTPRDDDKQNGTELPVVWVFGDAMQGNDGHPAENHYHKHNQVGGAGLHCLPVHWLVLADQTDHGDLGVGENYAADGDYFEHDGVSEAVHVIDKHTVTWEFKQGGVVTVRVLYHHPAAVQPDGQTQQDRHQN